MLTPVRFPDREKVRITTSGRNILVRRIIDDFCSFFAPGGEVIYIGSTGDKQRHGEMLEKLGVQMQEHVKIPDVIVHVPQKNWLMLIQAATRNGPIDSKRSNELKDLFKTASARLIFVTAFLTRRAMTKYLGDIAWQTEVWIAEAPAHLIHFNGERLLGPHA